jgi:hypothetical protein
MTIAFTASRRADDVLGRRRLVAGKLTLDNSYPTGGYPVTLATIKAKNVRAIEGCLILGGNPAGATRKFTWDSTNNKLMAHQTGAAVNGVFSETPNATDLSTITLDALFVCL